MPANLTPDYLAAERAFKQADTQQEKIAALEQMIAALPKHKGTEKMQADLRKRLSQARKESQKKGAAHATPAYIVKREGAGQVALIGPPNSGKSRLVCAMTHARPEVADYPFTTRLPIPGMLFFEDAPIQLLDTPAISAEFMEPWITQVVKNADLSVLVIDPNDADVLGEIEYVLTALESRRAPLPSILVANKLDLANGEESFAAIRELYNDRFQYFGVSALLGTGIGELAGAMFHGLHVVRFYSKPPGKRADLEKPYILRRGATVQDAAAHVHRDFADHLKYARLFHKTRDHDGMMVERTHLVEDQDILEFHM